MHRRIKVACDGLSKKAEALLYQKHLPNVLYPPTFTNFLLLPLFICAQSIRTDLEIDIPDDCAIDSILIQSMVRAEAKWIPAESRQLAELFHPVDIVLIMAQGASGMATLPPTPLGPVVPE